MPKGVALFETRYFILPMLFIQVLFFLIMDNIFTNSASTKSAPFFVFIIFTASVLFNIVFNNSDKVYEWGDPYSNSSGEITFYRYVGKRNYFWNEGSYILYNTLNQDADRNPGTNIVVTGFKLTFLHGPPGYAKHASICPQFDSILERKFHHSRPVIIYTMMHDTITEKERNFISFFKAEQILTCREGIIYRAFIR